MIGKELLADFRGCDEKTLQDVKTLESIITKSVEAVNANILDKKFHKFASGGMGVTGYVLLSESHVSIHTYPELGYTAIDIFTCGDLDPEKIFENIKDNLPHGSVEVKRIERG